MNTSILSALPNEVKAGDEIEVQLAPRGEYPQTVDGREVVQIIDDRSIKSLVANFDNIIVPLCLLTMLPNQTVLLGIAEIMQR